MDPQPPCCAALKDWTEPAGDGLGAELAPEAWPDDGHGAWGVPVLGLPACGPVGLEPGPEPFGEAEESLMCAQGIEDLGAAVPGFPDVGSTG